jgi:hypothetical protein
MPGLLAYLVALTVLLGGGYGGLHYLSEYSGSGLTQSQQTKLAARKKFEREAATRLASKDDAADEAAERPVAAATPPQPSSDLKASKAAPAIAAADPTPPPVPSVRQIAIDTPSNQAPARTVEAPAAAIEPRTSAPAANEVADEVAALSPAQPAAPLAAIVTTPARKPANAMAALPEPASKPVGPAEKPAVAAEDRPDNAVADRPVRKARKIQTREKPVLMTLQTIEYADGRLAQRLVPLQSPRRPAGITRVSRSEWFGGTLD